MDHTVEDYIKNCGECARSSKAQPGKNSRDDAAIPKPVQPAKQWGLDIAGPFYSGYYVVSLVDYFSRFPELLVTKTTTSQRIIEWLKITFGRTGFPDALVTDNGPQFVSSEFTDYLRRRSIHHYTTPVYTPQENGLVEVWNRTLKQGIQAFSRTTAWAEGLETLVRSYRMTPTSDGPPPAELFFGRKVRPEWVPNTTKPKRRIHQRPSASRRGEETVQKTPYVSWSKFRRGQKVLVRLPWVPKGTSPWKGPLVVRDVLGSFTFRLSDGQVWSARNMKSAIRDPEIPDQWQDEDAPVPPEQPVDTPRRSRRKNKGVPPQRLINTWTHIVFGMRLSPRRV